MKNLLEIAFKVFVIVSLAILLFLFLDKPQSIVYVDSIKLLNGYNGMKKAREEFKTKVDIWNAQIDTLKTELDVVAKDFETNRSNRSKSANAETEKEVMARQEQLMNYQKVIAEKVRQEDDALTKNVLGKVNDYIKKYGEQHGYKIIMAATQAGNIVYASKDSDVTDEVLEGLNNEVR